MTTQYKWLPEQPTDEMLGLMPRQYRRADFVNIYKAMWQAAPKREPLSGEQIEKLIEQLPYSSDIELDVTLVRLVEKAHGIGV
jgi:hypothetical protein